MNNPDTNPKKFIGKKISEEIGNVFSHSLIYGLGFAGAGLVSLLLTPLYTQMISPDDYGRLRLINLSVQLFMVFASLSLAEALFRFYYFTGDPAKRSKLFSTSFVALFVTLLLVSLFIWVFSKPLAELILDNPRQAYFFKFIAALVSSGGLLAFGLSYLRVTEQSLKYSVVSLTQLILALCINIVFVFYLHMGIKGVLLASLISQLLTLLLISSSLIPLIKPSFDFAILKSLLKYSLPLVPAAIFALLIINSSLFFLKHFSSLAQTGIFALSLQFGSAIYILIVAPFELAWGTMRFRLVQHTQAKQIFSTVLTWYLLISSTACLALTLFIDDLMKLIINHRYKEAHAFVGLVALSFLFYGLYRIVSFGFDYRKKTHLRSIVIMLGLCVNLTLNYLLIPLYGAFGAVISLLVAYLSMTVLSFFWAGKYYHIRLEQKRISIIVVSILFIILLSKNLTFQSIYLSLSLKSCFMIFYFFLLYIQGFFKVGELNSFFLHLKNHKKISFSGDKK